jgi:hypothetical protein
MHVKPTDMRSHHGQIFLILGRDARVDQVAAAVRARLGQGDVDALVDRGRRLSVGMAAMPSTRVTAGLPGLRGRRALRERRRLTLARPARGVKRLRQPLNLAPQTIALAFEPRVLVAQSITFIARLLDLATQAFQLPLSVLNRLRGVASRHATVMADSRKKYKPNLWIAPGDPLTSYVSGLGRSDKTTSAYRRAERNTALLPPLRPQRGRCCPARAATTGRNSTSNRIALPSPVVAAYSLMKNTS